MPILNEMSKTDEMDYLDCFTEAEEIRLIKIAIEQSLDVIEGESLTQAQNAALYTIKALCSFLDNVADIVWEIGRRDGND